MATSSQTQNEVMPPVSDWFVEDLLDLQRAAQKINSTLDLDELIDKIVNEVAVSFGCVETSIWLQDEYTDEMVLASVRGCTVNHKGMRLKIGREGMIGHVAMHGTTRYAPDVSLDPTYIACEQNMRSELDIPLKIGPRVIGVFSAVHPDLDGFPADKRRILEALCGHIAVAVQNARAFQMEREARVRMEKEAREARFIQESLLPKSSPLIARVALEATTLPAGEVGGDWYDYIDLGNNRWGIVLADVSGKGMAAALLMSATRGILRSLAQTVSTPAEVLSRLNCVLRDDFPNGRYVTMIYGILDGNNHTFTFANAGHPHPVLLRNGDVELVNGESGLPVGLASSSYHDRTVQLQHGVKLLLYSDGISEAENLEHEEFGTRRICEHMLQPHASAKSLLDAASAYSSCGVPCDDATVILIRCVEAD